MRVIEKKFQDDVRQLGCIVCRMFLHVRSDCDIHHILRGTRRISEMDVLGLCPSHHRFGIDNYIATSRHPNKSRFESRYGSEESLRLKTLELLKMDGRQRD